MSSSCVPIHTVVGAAYKFAPIIPPNSRPRDGEMSEWAAGYERRTPAEPRG